MGLQESQTKWLLAQVWQLVTVQGVKTPELAKSGPKGVVLVTQVPALGSNPASQAKQFDRRVEHDAQLASVHALK
jgi:hypothetical protein